MGENLIRRGIEVDGRCKRCGILETERHLFFQCSFTRRVWDLVPTTSKPNPNSISTPASFLTACERMINLPPSGLNNAALYPWVLWYLWSARNKFLFENSILAEQEVVSLALREARTGQAAQNAILKPSDVIKGRKIPRPCGPSGTNICFVDAAWNATTRGGGFGCIFKDPCNNNILHQSSTNRCFVGSAFIAEAIAVKTGLLKAITLGLRTLSVWSDSQSLINILNTKKKSTEAQGILFDIEHLSSRLASISFHHVPRLNNTDADADALAKLGLLNLVNSV